MKLKLKKNNNALFLLLFCFIAFMSTLYSANPLQTFIKAIEILTDLLLAWILYSVESKDDFIIKCLNVTIFTLFMLVLISLAGFFLDPGYFADNGYAAKLTTLGVRFGNGILGANSVGAYALLSILWAVSLSSFSKKTNLFIVVISIIAMIISQSRASLLLVPVVIFLRLFKPKDKYKYLYLALIFLIIGIAVAHVNDIQRYLLRGQSAADLSSFSGRTMMWSTAWKYILKSPLLGYGYGAGGQMVGKSLSGGFYGIKHMHNGFVELLVDVGWIGLIVALVPFISFTVSVIYNTLKMGLKNNIADITILLFFIIRSISSIGFGGWHGPELMLWYFLVIAVRPHYSIQFVFNNHRLKKIDAKQISTKQKYENSYIRNIA